MAKKRVADLLVDVLAEAGVRRIFGVSGDSLNGITDSIRASQKMEWIHLRHEKRQHLLRAQKPISPEGWLFVPEVAVPEICT